MADVSHGSVAWSDYNSDGYLDLLLSGQTAGGTAVSQLYRNQGGVSFSAVTTGLPALHDGSAAWGDYDNDGDPDLLLAGFDVFTPTAKIYRNDSGTFVDINAALVTTNAQWTRAAWGDYDNDGRLGCIAGAVIQTRGYITTTATTYSAIFTQDWRCRAERQSLAWGDYNADRRLDILLTGRTAAMYIRKFIETNSRRSILRPLRRPA